MITILDYGLGNPLSVKNMIRKAGGDAEITGDIAKITSAEALIIPGVGHFGHAMGKISELGLLDVLNKKALLDKIPVLGICLGMQLLFTHSEEGNSKGLGWIEGEVKKFTSTNVKIPHMGWSEVNPKTRTGLFAHFDDEIRFYFVHSYYVQCKHSENAIAQTQYDQIFDCAVQMGNIYGTQFHPEKSHSFGLKMMKNFISICLETKK